MRKLRDYKTRFILSKKKINKYEDGHKTVNLIWTPFFFFNYFINTPSKRFVCLQKNYLVILSHSSSIAIICKPIFRLEVAFFLFSIT